MSYRRLASTGHNAQWVEPEAGRFEQCARGIHRLDRHACDVLSRLPDTSGEAGLPWTGTRGRAWAQPDDSDPYPLRGGRGRTQARLGGVSLWTSELGVPRRRSVARRGASSDACKPYGNRPGIPV